MKDKLKKYVDTLFENADENQRNNDLKEELLGNLYDKYDSFIARGMSESEAYQSSIAGIGDISELFEKSERKESEESVRTDGTEKSKENPNESEWIPLYSREETDRKKKIYPIYHTVAIVLYILCVLPAAIGNSDAAAALMFLMIAAATAIFVYTAHTKPMSVSRDTSEEERAQIAKNRRMAGIFRASSVGLYIICVTPMMIIDSEFSIIFFFLFIAAATAIMILTPSLFPVGSKLKEDESKSESGSISSKPTKLSPLQVVLKVISSIIWICVIAFYLVISFETGRWLITWIIFPIAGFISGIVSGIFNLASARKIPSSIVKISLCTVFLCIFIPIFILGMRSDGIGFSGLSFFSVDSSFYANDTEQYYTENNAVIDTKISSVDVSWIEGSVTIEPWEKDFIGISETGRGELDEDEKFRWRVTHDGRLIIKYSEAKKLGFITVGIESDEAKDLKISVPSSLYCSSIEIEAVSAEIYISGLEGDELDLSTVSGNVNLDNLSFKNLEAEMVSGDIKLSGNFDTADFSMVSGKIYATILNVPRDFSLESVSGNIELTLPENISGFTVISDSLSEDVTIYRDVTEQNDRFVFGDGSFEISVETVSGKVIVK